MCITVNTAKLSRTKILSLPLENGNHFVAYSNRAENKSGKPNAMILPIPGTTKPEWFHNTEKYRNFLTDIASRAELEDWFPMRSLGIRSLSKGFEAFELGMYKIGLASSFEGAEEFISSLPESEQPEVSEELRSFFREHNAGWSFAVCCFSSERTIDAQPIAFEYAPFNSDLLYFPALDAHDGGAPRLTDGVIADHTLIYEHTGRFNKELTRMEYIELKDVPDFLNKRRYRLYERKGPHHNGDLYIRISDMENKAFHDDADVYWAAPKPHVDPVL